MLNLARAVFDQLCDQAFREYPLEMCGLIAGPLSDDGVADETVDQSADESVEAVAYYPCRNVAESAKFYTIDPNDHLAAELDAERHGWEILGVVHSHTHSEPFPSPTDIALAADPGWRYVIVSLKRDAPELRSYRIVADEVSEEPVSLG